MLEYLTQISTALMHQQFLMKKKIEKVNVFGTGKNPSGILIWFKAFLLSAHQQKKNKKQTKEILLLWLTLKHMPKINQY